MFLAIVVLEKVGTKACIDLPQRDNQLSNGNEKTCEKDIFAGCKRFPQNAVL